MAEQAVIANRYAEAGREPIEHQQRSQGWQTPKLGQQGIGRQQMNCQHETEGGPAGALWHRARLLAFAGVAQAGGAPGGRDAGECCAGHSDRIRIDHQIIAIRIQIKQGLGCGGVLS